MFFIKIALRFFFFIRFGGLGKWVDLTAHGHRETLGLGNEDLSLFEQIDKFVCDNIVKVRCIFFKKL